jgi:hypothetical protein
LAFFYVWQYVVLQADTDVSLEYAASIFRVEPEEELFDTLGESFQ